MQPPIADPYTDMPLNDADRAWVREAIRTAHEKHGLGKLAGFIKDWGGTGAAVTILIFFAVQWSGYIEFKTTTNIKLDRIEKALTPLTIQSQLSLPAPDFRATLPALESAVRTAKQEGLKVSPKVMSDLSAKLNNTDSTAPNFWSTTAVLISYRSLLLVGTVQDWSKQLPPCGEPTDLDSFPNPAVQTHDTEGKLTGPKIPITRIGETGCYIELDGKKISRWDCTRCLVKYSGGPLSISDARFVDCLFVFDFRSGQPSGPDGPNVSRTLLASELKDVTIPAAPRS